MLSWMTNFCYNCSRPDEMFKNGILNKDESKTFLKCENFLWHVRCQLHYIAKRPEEIINFNDQREKAKRLGYEDRKGLLGVERFMRHYFLIAKEVGDLTRSICSILEEKQKKTKEQKDRDMRYKTAQSKALKMLYRQKEVLYTLDDPEQLLKYSPKYNAILKKINSVNGLAFVYTEYRTLEGIAIFEIIFKNFIQ